jgi:putative serine/threonine protein kinase
MEFLAKGKRGFVYLKETDGKKVVVKKKNPESTAINRINHEANFLKEVNKLGIGPKYISHNENELVMQYVEGKIIEDFVKENNKKEILKVLIDVLEQCFKLDKIKISKEEMHHPYKHIIIGKKVVMIDWERAHKTLKPGNVTQFCQYLISSRFGGLLKDKRINIDKNKMIKLTKDYKENINSENFNKIVGVIKND